MNVHNRVYGKLNYNNRFKMAINTCTKKIEKKDTNLSDHAELKR